MRTPITAIGVSCLAIVLVIGAGHAQQNNGRPADRASAQGTAPVQRNDLLQPLVLPPLPVGMTNDMLVDGDRIFHGAGGCFVCHGVEAQGMPAAGDGITVGLAYIPGTWNAIDSLITSGMPDAVTRSPIAMPARGARGNLSRDDVARVAAYVWAISQVQGEPWPGGHAAHAQMALPQAASGTSNEVQQRLRRGPRGRPEAQP